MRASGSIRKVLTATLMLVIALWAEAGLALVATDQVMQCSMTMHRMHAMAAMPCCPDEEVQVPATTHPECCSNGDAAERPLAVVISSERSTMHPLDAVATVGSAAPEATQHFGVWRSALAHRYVKPVLELKTDLRI
jgi:hypothetical protein